MRLFEQTGAHLVFRRKGSGYVALDTSRPMPCLLGSKTWTNLQLDWPYTSYEAIRGEGTFSGIRYWTEMQAHDVLTKKDLGAFTGVTPKMFLGQIRVRRTRQGQVVTGYMEAPIAVNEWIEWPGGSLLLEVLGQSNEPIKMWRHMEIAVEAGRWVLNMRQSSRAFVTEKSYRGGVQDPVEAYTTSQFFIDLNVSWGYFRG